MYKYVSEFSRYVQLHFQGDILRAEGREEQDAIMQEKERKRLADDKRHKDAFVDTVKGNVLLRFVSNFFTIFTSLRLRKLKVVN